MTSRPVRVAVLSPEVMVVRGLTAMLTDVEGRLEPTAGVDLATDVVLYDVLGLHHGDGRDLEHALQHERVAVLAVGRELRPDLLTQALARGAHGWVDPGTDAEGLRRAVVEAPGLASGPADDRPRMPSDITPLRALLGRDAPLTDREVDVLTFITHGLSTREVATKCFLSINSVKTYVRSAYRKIGAESRTQAVIWCLQHGISPQAP